MFGAKIGAAGDVVSPPQLGEPVQTGSPFLKMMKKQRRKLNHRQRLFAKEYIVDFNATQAAIRAGYSKRSAPDTGFNLLTYPEVNEEIAKNLEDRSKRAEIDADWVLRQQVRIFERCMQDVPVLDRDGNPTGEYRFEVGGANKALENIGKHVNVKAFRESVELTGKNGGPIQHEYKQQVDDAKALLAKMTDAELEQYYKLALAASSRDSEPNKERLN